MTLYNVFYIHTYFGEPSHYEVTTNNFNKWLEQHNDERWLEVSCGNKEDVDHEKKECTCIELEDDFDVQECTMRMYNE